MNGPLRDYLLNTNQKHISWANFWFLSVKKLVGKIMSVTRIFYPLPYVACTRGKLSPVHFPPKINLCYITPHWLYLSWKFPPRVNWCYITPAIFKLRSFYPASSVDLKMDRGSAIFSFTVSVSLCSASGELNWRSKWGRLGTLVC